MTQYDDPNQYLENAEQLFSQADVERAINTIAQELNEHYVGEPPVVLCVMGGAVVFTGLLMSKLTFPLVFDYVQATRYQR